MPNTGPITPLYGKALLKSDDASQVPTYLVPMYQRNYAWGKGEIDQLIQDVCDSQKKNPDADYYIGTLVVFKRNADTFEVIDGQQRFTTLSLIAICLKHGKNRKNQIASHYDMGWYEKTNIVFESRPKSSASFAALFAQGGELHKLNDEAYNQGIIKGYRLIDEALNRLSPEEMESFARHLFEKVQIMRVAVPEDTDLNHYFEIMNSRGEQLEKHEIIKARMMAALNKIADQEDKAASIHAFNKVWEACSDMGRYVQYGFTPGERNELFGKNWGSFESPDFEALKKALPIAQKNATVTSNTPEEAALSIARIINLDASAIRAIGQKATIPKNDELKSDRFKSVINFSNFLLHVLKIWKTVPAPASAAGEADHFALDDKRLIDLFDLHVLRLDSDGDGQAEIAAVKSFGFALLKCKYLFDQYVLKREFFSNKESWSLKRLKWNGTASSFVNSFNASGQATDASDEEGGYKGKNREVLMLQSAFHVSAPTMAYKYWLYGALNYLWHQAPKQINAADYLNYLQAQAEAFVFERYLSGENKQSYFALLRLEREPKPITLTTTTVAERLRYGEIENNFVFNYLDYLIWYKCKDSDEVVGKFEFTNRSSVEHFFPQNPMNEKKLNKGPLDAFGNLCLISHSKNSRLSNFMPAAKLEMFQNDIDKKKIDSLKLYEMIKLFKKAGSKEWRTDEIEAHEGEMLKILCGEPASGANK
jgi:Protein of unknown function DUF262/Protein of unknown function (DUF1524)